MFRKIKRPVVSGILLFFSVIMAVSVATAYVNGNQTVKNEFHMATGAVLLFIILIIMNWPDKEFIKKLEEAKTSSQKEENKNRP